MDFRKTKRFWSKSSARAEPLKLEDLQLPAAKPDAGPPIDFAKTQVLPVEEVAKVLQAYRAEHKPPAFDGSRTQKLGHALRAPRLRARTWAAGGALVLIALAHAVLSTEPAPPHRTPAEPTHMLRPATAAAAAPAPAPNPVPAASPAPAPPAPKRVAHPLVGVSAKQAVDALAAGDLPRAAALYGALGERIPEDRVFATAARVLRARLAKAP